MHYHVWCYLDQLRTYRTTTIDTGCEGTRSQISACVAGIDSGNTAGGAIPWFTLRLFFGLFAVPGPFGGVCNLAPCPFLPFFSMTSDLPLESFHWTAIPSCRSPSFPDESCWLQDPVDTIGHLQETRGSADVAVESLGETHKTMLPWNSSFLAQLYGRDKIMFMVRRCLAHRLR